MVRELKGTMERKKAAWRSALPTDWLDWPSSNAQLEARGVSMFKLELKTDNAAFQGGNLYSELSRILLDLAANIAIREIGETGRASILRDVNGNKVGTWTLEA
jgi:hypothetical protein